MNRQWLVDQLLRIGCEREDAIRRRVIRHADEALADDLLHHDPFARLLGILSHQHRTQAGKAWEVPWRLQPVLGHLDPQRIISDEQQVRDAFSTGWIARNGTRMATITLSAAKTVLKDPYDGDASNVWDGIEDPVEVYRRFDEFDGAGQKIASMAVSILRRDFRVPIRPGGDIAVDKNVRRVFHRTGLVRPDGDNEEIRNAARVMHPEDPSALDFGDLGDRGQRRAVHRQAPIPRVLRPRRAVPKDRCWTSGPV
jgi:hypothetical protein